MAARCTEVESGARNVDNILTNTLLPDISRSCWRGWLPATSRRAFASASGQMVSSSIPDESE